MSFDRIAPHYRWLETLAMGRALQQCRVAWLDSVSDAREVLIVGEGDGRFLAECGKRLTAARFTVVDGSASMIKLAQTRWPAADFIQAELPGWKPPPRRFDVIVTHFFLDCFPPEEVRVVIACLSEGACARAKWLLADFREPEAGIGRLRARLLLAVAFGFFRVVANLRTSRLTAPDAFLAAAGFQLAERALFRGGLLYSDVWQRA